MKKIILAGVILLNCALFANENLIVKLNSQEIKLTEDNKTEDINFYSFDSKKYIKDNNIQSCILEENKRTETISIYCTNKELKTFYSVLNGVLNPDKTFFSYSMFINLKDLNFSLNKEKQEK